MKLAEAEVLRVVHYYGVDVRHVYAALYYGGGQEYVVFVVGEVENRLLQLVGGHLPVGHQRPGVRNDPFQHGLELVKPLDAVVHDEYLPVARQLEVHRLGKDVVVEGVHRRQDGVTVGRRGGDGAEVARPHKRELQRARNRRGRHREGVHVHLHLFQLLLDGDPELLLLVNDQQPQVLEPHVLAHDAVRPYEYVDFPFP